MTGSNEKDRGQAWIRVRGAPDDPESWDLGTWTGVVWEVRKELSNGRRVTLQIRDYLVAEQMPAASQPFALYKKDERDER